MKRVKNFSDLVCPPDMPINMVLRRLGDAPQTFQVVIDESGRIHGTVTDGDIRRALLRGVSLDQPVSEAMFGEPLTGRLGEDADNAEKLSLISRKNQSLVFLPLLDGGGVLREILVVDNPRTETPTALVMAGGFGTRLGDETRSVPKPLLDVGDGPVLGHVLRQLEIGGIRRIYVSTHHLSEKIEDFVGRRDGAAEIRMIREDEPMGTAGAIAELPPETSGTLLVVNGDVLSEVAVEALVDFHWRLGHDATIAAAQYVHQIPYGVVRHSESGLFEGVDEKPSIKQFVAAGIYVLSQEVRDLVPRGRAMDMPDLINAGHDTGLKLGLFPLHESWTDIGRPEDLLAVRREHGNAP